MSSPTKPSKREAILNATLDVVVERGVHGASMALISQRSGASAGVIYHHFTSKNAIIQALYDRIRAAQRDIFFAGYSSAMEPREAFLHVWVNGYGFFRRHVREMRFLEQYESAGFPCVPDEDGSGEGADFERRFRSEALGGVLRDWPKPVLHELTVGLVIRLARQPEELTSDVLRDLAAKMWDVVRATAVSV